MAKIVKKLFPGDFGVYLLMWAVKAYLLLVRVKVINPEELTDHIDNRGAVLLCVLHQQFFVLVKVAGKFLKYRPTVMISQSRDGEIASRFAETLGVRVIRGSSSKGGKQAMEQMVAHLAENSLGVHIVDGPRGPVGKVKPGCVSIAEKSGAALLPCLVFAESAWHLNSWDNFMIPKPFSSVTVKMGKVILPDMIKKPDNFEKIRANIEKTMSSCLIS